MADGFVLGATRAYRSRRVRCWVCGQMTTVETSVSEGRPWATDASVDGVSDGHALAWFSDAGGRPEVVCEVCV